MQPGSGDSMSPVPTPTLLTVSAEEQQYRGFALSQLAILRRTMALGGLNSGTRTVELENGVVITCRKVFNQEDVFVSTVQAPEGEELAVVILLHGFAVLPRSADFPNGIDVTKTITALDGHKTFVAATNALPMFPVFDNDHTTMLLWNTVVRKDSTGSITSTVPAIFLDHPPRENYGIISWVDDISRFTWAGWPCITIAPDRTTSVDGVTELDVETSMSRFYTPLRSRFYVDGISYNAPGKVRGACRSDSWTLVATTVNYSQFDFGTSDINPIGQDWQYDNKTSPFDPDPAIPDAIAIGKRGGYFDEIWAYVGTDEFYTVNGRLRKALQGVTNQNGASLDGWIRIAYVVSPVANLPCRFSSGGAVAISDYGDWSISYTDTPVPAIPPDGFDISKHSFGEFVCNFSAVTDTGVKQEVVTGSPDPWSVTSNGTWVFGRSHGGAAVTTTSRRDTTTTNIKPLTPEYNLVDVVYQRRPDPTVLYIDATGLPGNIYHLTLAGAKSAPITWTGATAINDTVAHLDLNGVCGIITVTATDACGFSATRYIAAMSGKWGTADYSGYYDALGNWSCSGNVSGYWDTPIPPTGIDATTYTNNKILTGGGWNGFENGDIICTVVQTWECA